MKNIFRVSIVLAAAIFASCSEELVKSDYDYTPNPENAPQNVVTGAVLEAASESAVVSGSVENDTTLLDWGVVYYKVEDADDPEKYSVKSATNAGFEFELTLTGLVASTEYQAKVFAMNLDGITYGEPVNFTTDTPLTYLVDLNESSSEDDWLAFIENVSTIDKDGDEEEWGFDNLAEEGELWAFYSASWNSEPLTPENYLIFSVETGTNTSFTLTAQALDANYCAEKFKMIASLEEITEDNCQDAEVLFEHTLEDGDPFTKTVVLPSSYDNQIVYLGIAHYDCTDNYYLTITAIKVTTKK